MGADGKMWGRPNQWMCFDKAHVNFESVEIQYGRIKKTMPQATVSTIGQIYEIAPSADLVFEMPQTLNDWLEMSDYQEEGDKTPLSFWVLTTIKSGHRYWDETLAIGRN